MFQDSAEDVGVELAAGVVGSGIVVAVVELGVVKGATGGVFVVDVDTLRRYVSCSGRCGRRHAILVVDAVEWIEERLAMA